MRNNGNIRDFVFLCMRHGEWWTFWELQDSIKRHTNIFYNENSISAAIRDLRKLKYRQRYGIDLNIDNPVIKQTIKKLNNNTGTEKGYKYKLIGVEHEQRN